MAVKHQAILPKLNRDSNHRKALFKNLLKELIKNGSITTTITKAKIIKRHIDKLVTKAKEGSLSARRSVIASLSDVKVGQRLFEVIAPSMSNRTSGYTTLRKVDVRKGDSTTMAELKFVDAIQEPKVEEPKKVEKKSSKLSSNKSK